MADLAIDVAEITPSEQAGLPPDTIRSRTVYGRLIKLTVDYTATLLLLVVFALPLVCIAVLIKLDSPGPVFFRQPRIGFQNRKFYIWKFRTMYADSTDLRGSLLTQRGDERITAVGSFLRKTSIDELPQLFNVLMRHMSLVGPRPHPFNAQAGNRTYAEVVPDYHLRHVVLPGITGWAQVNGWRGETQTSQQIEQRVAHDMEYIENWSVWLDLKIIALTAAEVCKRRAF